MPLKVINSLILKHKTNYLRDKKAPPEILRTLVEDITLMAMPYILEDFPKKEEKIETFFGEGPFEFIDEEKVVFVGIMRAGLPMLNGALKALARAKAGFLAIKRDEDTLKPKLYYKRLPDLKDKWVVVLDPMLATGGSISMAIEEVMAKNPRRIISFSIVASPEGIERVISSYPDIDLFVVSIDKGLNQKGYIVPGVGDIGDRLFTEYS